jgi:hypothetical protein
MTEKEWIVFSTICVFARIVRGGAMCHYYEGCVNYCTYEKCPRKNNVQ